MFTYHTKETAPADSLPLIELSIKTYGFFPRMHQILAEAPLTYEMYNTALDGLSNRSTFSPVEQELIMLTASYENRGNYSMAGHTMRAQRKHVPTTVIAALRDVWRLPTRSWRLFEHLCAQCWKSAAMSAMTSF